MNHLSSTGRSLREAPSHLTGTADGDVARVRGLERDVNGRAIERDQVMVRAGRKWVEVR